MMAQMRRFELLIARGRIGLLSALGLKADALLCSRAPNKRRPLCHICSYFSTSQSYYYMLIASSRSLVMIFPLFLITLSSLTAIILYLFKQQLIVITVNEQIRYNSSKNVKFMYIYSNVQSI
jgi:hypothetical protein